MRSPFFMLDFSRFDSLFDLVSFFNDDDICRDYLSEARWGDDVVCPYCGEHHCYRCSDGRFSCPNRECKATFNVTVGTIFESSHLPLRKWFMAIYLISSHKKGISSHQLAKDIKVTQKTAWNIEHKIRSCFAQNDEVALSGNVELDEAYIGGDNKWRHESKKIPHGQGGANKVAIFGLLQREDGRVVALKVDDTQKSTIEPIIAQFTNTDDTFYSTDESRIYNALTNHGTVNHALGVYSENGVTTNSIEGFWSHFKRMIKGIYHWVSEAYIQRYIDEECFRWNTRKWSEGERFKFVFGACIGRFTYEDVKLTKKVA